ncbi:DNA polymerase/3'-5' exonuclease PolX [Thermanaerothrix sp. 4228-RoL]|uniref:DNA polymerase beta n=1 Tax=Thermanaerothrix solaris TaxID=3058434 RepID=A0ABU3NQK6_9CHLR|nr:DNA polymerase/3'-5' exonuclease PolX [Thermanaerothrix sp. 4228-RoL]MDT8899129.1 DNA polymerase/3'-5' exonuclease PolX [Thermanaerothrix sp. 4228-RoL]
MTNEELAAVFEHIANLLEIKGENVYRVLSYRRVAESLRTLGQDVHVLRAQGRLQEIPGVGKAIAEKIEELLDTGELGFLKRLEAEVPPSLIDLLQIPDVGPKRAALFWKQAGITTLEALEEAARAGRLRHLPGMGEKSEARILEGIEALRRRSHRLPLGVARPMALRWLDWLRQQPGVVRAELAGSLRRWRSTVGDLDLVAASHQPKALMDAFVLHPEVYRIIAQGENKASIETRNGTRLQLWCQPPEKFGSLWQYATGSKDHNVRLRGLAQKRGLSLSEHGLSDEDGHEIHFTTEEDLYHALGLPWIPPELREDRGEIEAALNGTLPPMLQREDLKAELHTHSNWSDGAATLDEMVSAAYQRGLRVIAITDHSAGLGIANGLTPERLREQRAEIETLHQRWGDKIVILQGAEVEIRADGHLDYPDEVLAELDIVIASLHVSLRQPRAEVTQRLLNAIRNPQVDIIGHPSGRLLPNREGADLDWEMVLTTAQQYGVALEINANPARLDLDDVYARRAAEMGIPLALNTDSHTPTDFDLIEYGIGIARRAWVEPSQIINTWSPERLLAWLRARG